MVGRDNIKSDLNTIKFDDLKGRKLQLKRTYFLI